MFKEIFFRSIQKLTQPKKSTSMLLPRLVASIIFVNGGSGLVGSSVTSRLFHASGGAITRSSRLFSTAGGDDSRKSRSLAVLGAGLSGLACAIEAAKAGGNTVEVSLFEQSGRPGGRASSRSVNGTVFDHGCQYFSPKTNEMTADVKKWIEAGVVADWKGRFGVVDVGEGRYEEDDEDSRKQRLVGSPSMSALAAHLLEEARESGVKIHLGARVKALKEGGDGGWSVKYRSPSGEDGEQQADIVVASDCLMAPLIEDIESAQDIKRAMLARGTTGSATACFVAMVEVKGPTNLPNGFRVTGSGAVAWMAKESSKPNRREIDSNKMEIWTIHSTPDYARLLIKKHGFTRRGSEEHVSLLNEAGNDLLKGAEEVLTSAAASLGGHDFSKAEVVKCHRWGAGFPSSAGSDDGSRFMASTCRTVFGCGDWAARPKERGRVEAAVLSGKAAARAALDLN